MWQFKTADGKIKTLPTFFHKYDATTDVFPDRTVSKVDIPENAVSARVYFACLSDDNTDRLDDRLQIEYGRVPTNYEEYYSQEFTLPDCHVASFFSLENQDLYLNTNHKKEPITLSSRPITIGTTISVIADSDIAFEISVDDYIPEEKSQKQYGIRYNTKDRNPVCERVGDAKELHFNATIENSFITPYKNDFDYIYPWSQIRLCAIQVTKDGERHITYSDSKEFKRDGSFGEVMVEIPKFYLKRELIDDYDYLWIAGEPVEGFVIDPSFQTKDGELDHIYIAAYHSTLVNDRLSSFHDSYPIIKKSMDQILSMIPDQSPFKECDLLTILTVQRLFLVETALLDSQSLFTGNTLLPYLQRDKSTPYYALISEKATNRIRVKASNITRRFRVGDSVTLIKNWREYDNVIDQYQRQITEILEPEKNQFEIHFTGNPIDIVERDTGITCIPSKNGKTDFITYPTGAVAGTPGHYSFKYRYIENLWGNVPIYVGGAYILNNELYFTNATGETKKLGYPLPIQNIQLLPKKFGNPSGMIVKKMGYDQENPLIMFPIEIGNGALTTAYYCDAWYNLGAKDVTYILTYGGAWDNKGYAGIFNFRASFTSKEVIAFNGSRLMMR